MVSIQRIQEGLAAYVDNEILITLPTEGWERVAVGVAASIAIKKMGGNVASFFDNKAVKALGLVNEAGEVDIETIREAAKEKIPPSGMKIDIPFIGTMTFKPDDVEKLYHYITK